MLLIVIWLLWKSYEWEPEAINEFHDLTSKWMAHYYFGKITEEDMIGMIQAINDELGIDLTERVLLKEDMLDETPG